MPLRVDVLTLFPRMFEGVFGESLLGKACERGRVDLRVTDIRDFCFDKHRTADDRPYGGGPGMVLKAEPVYEALKSVGAGSPLRGPGARRVKSRPWVVFMSPQGKRLTQPIADRLSKMKRLVVIAGHYEGIDERLMDWVNEEISVGDVVLTGGEIPSMALVDAVARKVSGVVKEEGSLHWDSFAPGWKGRLDCGHYTRPGLWRGRPVPEELVSGDHGRIQAWRETSSLSATALKRPDLIQPITRSRRAKE